MKTIMKHFKGRIALIVMVVLVLATLLVSCGGGQTGPTLGVKTPDIPTQDKTLIDPETQQEITVKENLTALGQPQLEGILNMMKSAYSNGFDVHEMLIAASRGWDMTAEGFKDQNVPLHPETGLPMRGESDPVETAKRVLHAANGKAKTIAAPEDINKINEYDLDVLINCMKMEASLETDTGFFGMILVGIGKVLGWITKYLGFGSYFVGICIFAILIEILMLPFGIKQQKNSIRQAELRPKEMAIRNKYKGRNDQVTMQKMNQEIQEFYQRENFSPFSGCLPLLIQLPIIMALYNIIIDPLFYVMGQGAGVSEALTTFVTTSRAAGGLGMTLSGSGSIALLAEIKDIPSHLFNGLNDFAYYSNGDKVLIAYGSIMKNVPNFNIGALNFGLTPGFTADTWILLFVPILTFVTYFGTSKLNRKFMAQPATNGGADARQMACSNNMMDFTMPAMSTFFTFMVPALIGVYWVFRSLVGLLKQFILSRLMPLPKFTEEDYKAAAREMAGKSRPVKNSENAGKVRSLHFIDDEDFEDTRARGLARRAAFEEKEREEAKTKSDKTPLGAAPMKEDKKPVKKKKPATKASEDAPKAAEEITEKASEEKTENNEQE